MYKVVMCVKYNVWQFNCLNTSGVEKLKIKIKLKLCNISINNVIDFPQSNKHFHKM